MLEFGAPIKSQVAFNVCTYNSTKLRQMAVVDQMADMDQMAVVDQMPAVDYVCVCALGHEGMTPNVPLICSWCDLEQGVCLVTWLGGCGAPQST